MIYLLISYKSCIFAAHSRVIGTGTTDSRQITNLRTCPYDPCPYDPTSNFVGSLQNLSPDPFLRKDLKC